MSPERVEEALPRIMAPPTGFLERSVTRALARVRAEEALGRLPLEAPASNDTRRVERVSHPIPA
jgi:hypothetical protein